MSALPRLIVVLGPTASGKSTLGIRLAEKLGGEILVCDSTQVYRHFDIGTAKVPASERRGIAHHLVDLCEPAEIFTAGDYRRRALEALDDLRARKILPILTAGTGLYLRALLEGLADAPQRSEEIRARLRQRAAQRGPRSERTQDSANPHRRNRLVFARAARRASRCAAALRRNPRPLAAAGRTARSQALASCASTSRSRIRGAHLFARHAKNNSRRRIAPAHWKTNGRDPSQRPRCAARLRNNQNRPAAAPRSALRTHSCTHRCDARSRVA